MHDWVLFFLPSYFFGWWHTWCQLHSKIMTQNHRQQKTRKLGIFCSSVWALKPKIKRCWLFDVVRRSNTFEFLQNNKKCSKFENRNHLCNRKQHHQNFKTPTMRGNNHKCYIEQALLLQFKVHECRYLIQKSKQFFLISTN